MAPGDTTVEAVERRRVDWHDGTYARDGWIVRLASAGGSLRSLRDKPPEHLGVCWIARERGEDEQSAPRLSAAERAAVGSMLRVLARGAAPPMHPEAEKQLLEACVGDPEPTGEDFLVPSKGKSMLTGDWYDSEFEEQLVERIEEDRPGAAMWLVPQPLLDMLAFAAGVDAEVDGERRCDFLFCPPGSMPVVFEVDGAQHQDAKLEDKDRDRLLKKAGIRSVRVPTSELRAERGPGLDQVIKVVAEARFGRRAGAQRDRQAWHPKVWGPIQTHRLMLAICEAIDAGFLSGERWVIDVSDPTGLSPKLIGPYLETLAAAAEIWGADKLVPRIVVFRRGSTEFVHRRQGDIEFSYVLEETKSRSEPASVRVLLGSHWSPFERLPDSVDGGPPTVVVRSTGVPALPRDPVRPRVDIRPAGGDPDRLRLALEAVMKAVFAKDSFRAGQFEAVKTTLSGRDCAVLLPTGAGKSMIYQLAGLVLPGRLLVVDPITALIDDQIGGLTAEGIDRAVGITAQNSRSGLGTAEDAYFLFVAPERLQRQKFREMLAASARSTPVSLVVVDEAHCVSEWGHDFRDAYLNFGRTARKVCNPSGHDAVPILALTGTASRAVLSDVLFQLGISGDSPESIISPASFDRAELSYEVVITKPDMSEATLKDVLRTLPSSFGEQPSAFRTRGGLPGIVFIPTVNGMHRSMDRALDAVSSIIPTAVGFSTTAPRSRKRREWDVERLRNAEKFKRDEAAAIVATKAFGMGIDKPNIRWIVHFGLPQSIEAFYQEVGRAGRNRQPARSVLILAENSSAQSKERLESGRNMPSSSKGGPRPVRDDIATVLRFHNQAFPSVDKDVETTEEVYGKLCSSRSIPLGESEDQRNASKRALHRLAVLGVVEDYCIEGFGDSEKAVVVMSDAGPPQIADSLLGFVARSQPGQVEAYRIRLPRLINARSAVRECSRLLAEFVYDTIGKARQRSLYEMWELARVGQRGGELVRQSILDYLSDGVPSTTAQRLAEQAVFAYSDWIGEWKKIASEGDARQWRAAAARLLGSYPDHPGLLASRAVAGVLVGGSADDFETGLRQSIESALERYRADPADAEHMAMEVLDWFAARGLPESVVEPLAAAAAVVAAVRAALPTCERVDAWLDSNWKRSPHLAVFKFAEGVALANELAHYAADSAGGLPIPAMATTERKSR
ncbi:MAG: RecQ family ATP-dependent DNA helicase [Acidimicrobiia bacterium]|nr:RecQ family ATP-dependent DNA helicase [Acidimicrobiia bacterium]